MDIKVLASGSKGNCYYVSDGKTPLLLECGIPWKEIKIALNFNTSQIEGCLVSHEHKDHCKAINEVVKAGIDTFASQGTLSSLGINVHNAHAVSSLNQFHICSWTVLPFQTEHDVAEPLGFLLASDTGEKLLFATDTFYLRYKFQGLTAIMIECNYSLDILRENVANGTIDVSLKNRIIKSHFSLENVKEFLKANDLSKVEAIYLIHLSDGNSDEKRFRKEIQQLTGKPVYVA